MSEVGFQGKKTGDGDKSMTKAIQQQEPICTSVSILNRKGWSVKKRQNIKITILLPLPYETAAGSNNGVTVLFITSNKFDELHDVLNMRLNQTNIL